MLRRYARLGDRDEIEKTWLPGFVERNLAYWRRSTEGPAERELFDRIDRGEKLSAVDVARDRFMWGTPDELISEIREYARLGPTEFSVSFTGGMTTHRWEVHKENDYRDYLEAIETFGREIIPAFGD
jgi:hypothetical protein